MTYSGKSSMKHPIASCSPQNKFCTQIHPGTSDCHWRLVATSVSLRSLAGSLSSAQIKAQRPNPKAFYHVLKVPTCQHATCAKFDRKLMSIYDIFTAVPVWGVAHMQIRELLATFEPICCSQQNSNFMV